LIPLIIREAGKSAANAVAEIREAVDFLRYYAEQTRSTLQPSSKPLGPIVCISPWNFPLAIFTGQIAASLAAGNPVLAKPAEETPLIAAECIRILHQAGVPRDGLQLLTGDGTIGAALVSAPEIAGVVFTGSTEVAKKIQVQLSNRLSANGRIIPLIAETGGLNAMIVDSSALSEQVVADVISSAFDSAGQRCSALRLLCIQSDVADKIIEMLHGAMHELSVKTTDQLSADVGPVITREAANTIENHIETMRKSGCPVTQTELDGSEANGTYVAPTVIEIDDISELKREIFGPVLHVVRFERKNLSKTIAKINSTGFGLTFGVHTRINETMAAVTSQIDVGNIYVNRNIVGAVVGVQPFGGRGLSGTGPKAGGPLYIHRLVAATCEHLKPDIAPANEALSHFISWLEREAPAEVVLCVKDQAKRSPLGYGRELKGPVGESNLYYLKPRGRVLISPLTESGLLCQIGAALSTGNDIITDAPGTLRELLRKLPRPVSSRISCVDRWETAEAFSAALIEGDQDRIRSINERISTLPGPIPIVQAANSGVVSSNDYCLNWLIEEVSTSINTTAAGGNTGLLALD
jgi:RHH-type proline utilization regulon transcriptional repressor/proline dehydrogenase/delta 1-pyrroline-5-carboxylate dehydrogenase